MIHVVKLLQVTAVSGLETFLLDPGVCSKDFAKRFACATTLEKLTGQKKDSMEVKIQGEIADKVSQYLSSSLGISQQYISIKTA